MQGRLIAVVLAGLIGSGLAAGGSVTTHLTLAVEAVCQASFPAPGQLVVKCTAGSPAPADPRLLAGVPFSSAWTLAGHLPSPDGAELFVYRPGPPAPVGTSLDLY